MPKKAIKFASKKFVYKKLNCKVIRCYKFEIQAYGGYHSFLSFYPNQSIAIGACKVLAREIISENSRKTPSLKQIIKKCTKK